MRVLEKSLHKARLIIGKVLRKTSNLVMEKQYLYEVFKESCYAKGYLIDEYDDGLKIKIDNEHAVTLRNGSSDSEVFAQVFLSGEYSPAVHFLKNNGIDVKHIMDCGANIGISSVYFNSKFPGAAIYAVEPEPANYHCLEQNLSSLSGVKKINKAIWFEKCYLSFDRSFRDRKEWSVRVRTTENNEKADIQVEATTISDIISEFSIETIDLLKIDIEGAEKELFSKPEYLQFLQKTKVIVMEIHDEFNIRAHIHQMLRANNFLIFETNDTTIGFNLNYIKNNHSRPIDL